MQLIIWAVRGCSRMLLFLTISRAWFFHVKKVPNLPKSWEKFWSWKNLSSGSRDSSVLKSWFRTRLSKLATNFATKRGKTSERPRTPISYFVLNFFCRLLSRGERNESWRQHKIQDSRKVGRVGMKKPVKCWDFWEETFDWGILEMKV